MSAFLLAGGLALLFVVGAVFGLRPTPRQRQLALLRHAAVTAGLRVRLRHGEALVDYVLPWRAVDLEGARATDFRASRAADGDWSLDVRCGLEQARLRPALEPLPAAVASVVGGADGLAARWPERGSATDVALIAQALSRLREACAQAR
jgi:hypothetical protein